MMLALEEDILQGIDSSIEDDQGQWPEFALKKVKVTSAATGEITSLLAAHKNSLLRVEGLLQDISFEHSNLVKPFSDRKKWLRIDDVATYSFSQWDDGSLGFWAAGRAGWYEIRSPALEYEYIYRSMEEATGMFYYLADKHRKARSSRAREPVRVQEAAVRSLMIGYLSNDCNHREDSDDVIEGFYEHRRFLLKSMLEGQEGLDWESSLIFRHLSKKFTKDFLEIQNVVTETSISATEEEAKPSSAISNEADLSSADEGVTTDYAVERPETAKRRSLLRPKREQSSKTYSRHEPRRKRLGSVSDNGFDTVTSDDEASPGLALARRSKASELPDNTNESANASVSTNLVVSNTALSAYYEPQDTGDSWACPYDGCNHKVWNARSVDSVQLIKKHFSRVHMGNMEELIRSESRPWVPVSRLLEQVQRFAAQVDDNQQATAHLQPQERIRKRY